MLQSMFGNTTPTTTKNKTVIPGVTYNKPTGWVDEYGGNGELMGVSQWDQYFTGLEGLGEGYSVEGVYGQGSAGVGGAPSSFTINRADPSGNKNVYQQKQLSVNPDGTVSWADGSDWTSKTQQSQMGHFLEAGLPMALAMAGGMYATGGLGGTGASAGLGSGGGASTGSLATNPALIESAVGTTGYGASSAGAGGVSGLGSLLNGGLPKLSTGNSVADQLLGNVAKSFLGGGSGGISNLGNLSSLFSNYKQYSNTGKLMDEIKGIYSPDGPYAKRLEQELGRRDAAAGRNSQYGPRLEELMGRLGDSQARALQGLGPMMATQQGGLNGMLGAGNRLLGDFNLMDLFGGNSLGGMLAGEAGSTPDMWDRVSEDIDWESLFGG